MLSGVSKTSVVVWAAMLGGVAGAQTQVGGTATAQVSGNPVQPSSASTVSHAAGGVAPLAAEAGVSQVRIVRLSQARGVVQMDRNTGRGFEPAFANIPIIAGARLRTGEGVAEVEFEDNSTLRLAPSSEVAFRQLARTATGATVTTVQLGAGMVYASLEKTKGDQFVLVDGEARLALAPGARIRVEKNGPQASLAVFDGATSVELGGVTTAVNKKQTVTLNPAAGTVSTVSKGVEEATWDTWNKQQTDYHKGVAGLANAGGFGLYGANDLSYYGSFVNMPGCGSMWRPYFANAAWDPFGNGTWAYYPGAGYSWVSPYPWGWLPFHSGSWTSCGGAGWGWQPGGSWYGLNNTVAMRLAKYPSPHPLPPPPARNAATLVPVNTRPLPVSGVTKGDAFTFHQNSAGLGVPRETFGHLGGVSSNVARHGTVTSSMAPAAVGAAQNSSLAAQGMLNGRSSGPAPGLAPGPGRSSGSLSSGGGRSGPISSPSAGMPSTSGGSAAGARH